MKILGLIPKKSAVTTYRVIRPLSKVGGKTLFCFKTGFGSLLKKNEKLSIKELGKRFKEKADVLVIKYIEDFNTANILVTIANQENIKLVVDIDDNIWEIPYGNITIQGKDALDAHVKRGFWMIELLKAAHAVTVSTEPLKEKLKSFNDNITVIPNLIDPKDWKLKPTKHKKIRIGWIYSHTHIPDVKVVKKALNEIHAKYGDRVEIIIFGSDLKVFEFEPIHYWGVKFAEYPKKLTELGLDISICPLEDNEFNKCKSNIKWMESSMAGAAVVASPVYPYKTSIEHGKTGYLAKNTKEWVKYISELVENEEKRQELVKNAQEGVIEKYNHNKDNSVQEFYKSL